MRLIEFLKVLDSSFTVELHLRNVIISTPLHLLHYLDDRSLNLRIGTISFFGERVVVIYLLEVDYES